MIHKIIIYTKLNCSVHCIISFLTIVIFDHENSESMHTCTFIHREIM